MSSKYFANNPYSARGCAIVAACLLLAGVALIMVLVAVAWRLA